MQVKIHVENDKLKAVVTSYSLNDDLEYYFYLLKNGSVIDRHGWTKCASFGWELKESGCYQVRGFVRNTKEKIDRFSEIVTYYSKNFEEEWKNFKLSNNLDEVEEELFSYHNLEEPFQDFLVVFSNDMEELNIKQFPQLKATYIGKYLIYSQKEPCTLPNDTFMFFSGNAFINDTLVLGEEDILSNVIDEKRFIDVTGDYTTIIATEKELLITNDYFGNQKLYYGIVSGITFISNRYHLLLLAVAAYCSKEDVKFDSELGTAILTSGKGQPYQQIFSHDMLVNPIKLLPIDKKIKVIFSKVYLENKAIHDILNESKKELSAEEYYQCLKDGVNEIIEHTKGVIENNGLKNILVDLTGGLDSRTLFSAITNFPEAKDKICINSADTPGYPKDQQIAFTINSIYGYAYDDTDEYIYMETPIEKVSKQLSLLCGVYFAHNLKPLMERGTRTKLTTVNLTGFFGEICLRPYYSRTYFNTNLDNLSLDEFIFRFVHEEQHTLLGTTENRNALENIFRKTLEGLPGETSLEKYDFLYLYFRNGLHCSDVYRYNHGIPRIGVIQSPKLFRLKVQTYRNIGTLQLQRDVIEMLNPLLNHFPLCRPEDEVDFGKLKNTWSADKRFDIVEFPLNYQTEKEKLQESNQKKKIITQSSKLYSEKQITKIDIQQIALDALYKLTYVYNVLDIEVGKVIYLALKSSEDYILQNKILGIYQQVRIF